MTAMIFISLFILNGVTSTPYTTADVEGLSAICKSVPPYQQLVELFSTEPTTDDSSTASTTTALASEWLQCLIDLKSVCAGSYHSAKVSKAILTANAPLLVGSYVQCMAQPKTTHCTLKLASLFQGICVPSSCGFLADKPTREVNGTVISDINCGSHKETSYTNGSIFMVCLCFFLLSLVLISSTLDHHWTQQDQENKMERQGDADLSFHLLAGETPDLSTSQNINRPKTKKLRNHPTTKMLLCFSVFRNWKSLIERSPTRKYKALDGIRALSMFWIINGHTLNFQTFIGQQQYDAAIFYTQTVQEASLVMFTYGANLGVDTFFFLSGFLSTLVLLRKIQKGGLKAPAAPFVVLHRYLRLTPTLLFMIGVYYLLTGHMGSGPFWHLMNKNSAACGNYWWTNILYINNFYPAVYADTCASWTWYLANDMQFFVIGLIVIFIYYRYNALGYSIIALLVIQGMVVTGILAHEYRIKSLDTSGNMQNKIYDKPYTRIGAYAIGMLTLLLFTNGHWKVEKKLTVVVTHIFAYLILFGAAIIPILDWQPNGIATGGSWTLTENLYGLTFPRVVWTIGVALLTLLCISGHGGITDILLSFGFWDPIAKLTYSAYLIHPVIMRVVYFNAYQLYVYSTIDYLMKFLGFLVLTYSFATIIYLSVESPFGELEKLLTTRQRAKPTNPVTV